MKKTILFVSVLTLSLPPALRAQAAPDLSQSLIGAFNLHDTNALVNAREINLSPVFKWDSAGEQPGGGVKADWWATDQQGAFLAYDEFRDRTSRINFGYQARTVFNGLEVSLGVGTSQPGDADFGDVKLLVTPTLTWPLVKSENWDVRIAFGADLFVGEKPSPFLGLTFRALKF